MPHQRRACAVTTALGVTLAALLAGPVTHADPSPPAPKASDVQHAQQHAHHPHHEASRQRPQARDAGAQLPAASTNAYAALQQLQQAQAAVRRAQHAHRIAQDRLRRARKHVAVAQQRLATYAVHAYERGGASSSLTTIAEIASGSADPQQVIDRMVLINLVGDLHGSVVADFRRAERAQHRAEQAAAGTLRQAHRIRRRERAAIDAAAARARASGEIAATCKSRDTSSYSNGHLPPSVLCPLWATHGQALGEGAATAFNRMSHAYARQLGRPICVTSSYRSYAEQVSLKASRGRFAARPGRSMHGWGRAVDLCGGVQTDGTPPNAWMRAHAAQFGRYHPSWAERGGNGPYEPWHWNFTGR